MSSTPFRRRESAPKALPDRSDEELLDLRPGQRYLVFCSLKDTPDSRPHMELGMAGFFEVR